MCVCVCVCVLVNLMVTWYLLLYVQALEELRAEILGAETVSSPDRNPLDYATVATQTDIQPLPPQQPQSGVKDEKKKEKKDEVPAILQVNHTDPYTSLTNGLVSVCVCVCVCNAVTIMTTCMYMF